jgi:hypothetical protein
MKPLKVGKFETELPILHATLNNLFKRLSICGGAFKIGRFVCRQTTRDLMRLLFEVYGNG